MAEADVGAAQSSCCGHSGDEALVGGDSDVGVGQVVGGGTIEQGCKESDNEATQPNVYGFEERLLFHRKSKRRLPFAKHFLFFISCVLVQLFFVLAVHSDEG
jgi:hypothetical protein